MSGEVKLASAGDDIKVWDTGSYSVIQQFNPHVDSNIAGLSWSNENDFLVSVAVNSEKIILTSVKSHATTYLELNCVPGRHCVSFNSSSRYLLCGGADGITNIWDIKSKKIKKSYKDHKGPVTCAKFNSNDTYIASGSETGEIILYNVVTGQGSSPLVAPKVQAIKQLQYHFFRKSLLGSVSDDGAVNLWDTNTRRLLHSFSNSHHAPATGLFFSPINEILLMSVGLDKRFICYDVENKKQVKVITAESPLTSVAVKPDGVTVAVGSTRGKIYLYDLRQSGVVKEMNAHKSSVQCLQYQVLTKGKKSHSISPPRHRQLPPAPMKTNIYSKGDGVGLRDRVSTADGNVVDEVFSPVREGYQDVSSENRTNSLHGSTTAEPGNVKPDEMCSGGIFSPLSDSNTGRRYGDSNLGVSPLSTQPPNLAPPYSLQNGVHVPSLDYNIIHNANNSGGMYSTDYLAHEGGTVGTVAPQSQELDASPSSAGDSGRQNIQGVSSHGASVFTAATVHGVSGHRVSVFTPPTEKLQHSPHSAQQNDGSPTLQGYSRASSHSHSSEGSKQVNFSTDGTTASHQALSPEGACAVTQTVPPSDRSLSHIQPSRVPSGGDIQASGVSQTQDFQTQFIRNLINEALEEFRDEVHQDMKNLQLEMIRQFQMQQVEIRSLLQQFSVNGELVEEVQRLREENKRLKKNF